MRRQSTDSATSRCPDPHEDVSLVERFYEYHYEAVFERGGMAGRSYRATHRALEKRLPRHGGRILEIGAGRGQHLPFVTHDFDEYVMIDLSDAPANPSWNDDSRVQWIAGDIQTPRPEIGTFDRIVCTCVLHHVADVAAVLRNVRTWLKPGGLFSLFLSSDPGLLNRLNRRVFVEPRARRSGFNSYRLVNAREHRNHYWSIRRELLHQFSDCDISRRYYPFGIPAAGLSLFSIWQITAPEIGQSTSD